MKPTLLVLAAGMGSRYGGMKQIDSVGKNGECLLDFSTYDALNNGFGKVVYIIRREIEKDFRERFFDRVARNVDAEYVFQEKMGLMTEEEQSRVFQGRQKPWGTVHAVLSAEKALKTPFAVINADDYYGRECFVTLGKYLDSLKPEDTEHAMVGYVLKNTMSNSGSVSRGVCTVKDGYLDSIKENTKIYWKDGKVISELDGKEILLTGDERVSMNLFGFNLNALETFNEYWDSFKREKLGFEKTEALLPEAAGQIIRDGKGKLKFFTSTEKWFGMTYPEDKAEVQRSIAEKIESGYYGPKLWEK